MKRVRKHLLLETAEEVREHLLRCDFCNFDKPCMGCELGGDVPHHRCCLPDPRPEPEPEPESTGYTVGDLKQHLADVPDDYRVIAEGCDCVGDATGVEIDHTGQDVLVARQVRGKNVIGKPKEGANE